MLRSPRHQSATKFVLLMLPLAIGEISVIFWLLIKGVRAADSVATTA